MFPLEGVVAKNFGSWVSTSSESKDSSPHWEERLKSASLLRFKKESTLISFSESFLVFWQLGNVITADK